MVRRQLAGQGSRGKAGRKEGDLGQGRNMGMNLEHNEEVQLTAPLQMWGRHGGVGLRVEESHHVGQNYSESLAGLRRSPSPAVLLQQRCWLSSGAQGTTARPSNADGWGQDRHRRGGEGMVRTQNSTAERLWNVETPRPWFCAHTMIKRKEKARTHTEQVVTCSVP